ncbi:MAG: KEOPS complex subunit Pcc1, partial [Thermoproteota archaeon]|nr:KEOPS complex subunit Pcc1 [Thermoproteota archaeon]
MKAHVTVTLSFPSKKRLNTVLQALKPETESSPTLRSRVELQGNGKSLTLRFEAKDTTALRASVNSYLRWISSTE